MTRGRGLSRRRAAAAAMLGRLAHRVWRSSSWVFRSAWRMLTAAWLTGFFVIGQASMALADDGLITGPDLGTAGGQTVFEQYGPERFSLYLQLSDSNHGAPYITESMWNFLRSSESALLYMVSALARGAITSMQWMLNLNLYSQNAATIDSAVRAVAAQVFWPLFTATMAVGAFTAYGRMKREGGSMFHDAAWLVAASIFAAAFAIAPSSVMSTLDDARTSLGAAAMRGYSAFGPAGESAAGFPAVELPADQQGATRKLGDAMWNVYVVTPWCYVNFNSLQVCKDVGHDYIAGSERWNGLVEWMDGNDGGNSDDASGEAYCPPELNANCDWVRGQSFGRLGATIFVVLTTVPLVVMLLVLVLFGVMAVVGFLLLVLIGLFFVLGWMIPGRPRQMGVRWFEEVLGSLLQSVIITAILGAVMVLGAILSAGIPTYGYFMVGLLNLAVFVVGFRMRGRLENIAGLGAGASSSPFSGYMAMRAMGSLGRAAKGMTGNMLGGAKTALPILGGAGLGMARAGGQGIAAGARGLGAAGHLLRTLPNNLLATAGGGGKGPIVTPYRAPGSGRVTGRPAITGSARPGGAVAELPPATTTETGRSRALEAGGTSRRVQGDRHVFVAPDPTATTPRRTFAPTTHPGRAGRQAEVTSGLAGPRTPATPTVVDAVPDARSWQPSPRPATPARAQLVAPPPRVPTATTPAARPAFPTSRTGSRPLPHRVTVTDRSTGKGPAR